MNLANRLAEKLAASLGYDDQKRQVIAYGLGAALQMISLLLIAIVFGCLFCCLPECMVIFWCVGLMRRSTGGVHCATYASCLFTSSLSVCVMALLCRYLIPNNLPKIGYLLFGIVPAFACLGWHIYRRAPMGSEHKPIVNPKKIARLRRSSFATLAVYLTISLCLLFLPQTGGRHINILCAMIAVAWWQSFTLTSASGNLVCCMDNMFRSTI